jgi:uncharacterized protein YndB with AHSA1/START domain
MENQVIVENRYDVSAGVLWKAVTDKTEMKKWYFDLEEFTPEIGVEFQFWGESENRKYLHICKITEVVPGKKICYTWRYDGIPGETMVCFEIEEVDKENTNLILTHSGFSSFPSDNKDLSVENFKKGWTFILGTSLRNYLAK